MSSDYKLEPSYQGLPPVAAVAEHAKRGGWWIVEMHHDVAAIQFSIQRGVLCGKIGSRGKWEIVKDGFGVGAKFTPWPVDAVTRADHAKAVAAAYREGWLAKPEWGAANLDMDWKASNARAGLEQNNKE